MLVSVIFKRYRELPETAERIVNFLKLDMCLGEGSPLCPKQALGVPFHSQPGERGGGKFRSRDKTPVVGVD